MTAEPTRPCPICGKPRQERWRPFCSKRCADLDLHHWLTGRYAIPAAESDEPDEEALPEGAQANGHGDPERE